MALAVSESRHGLLAHYEEDQVIGRSLRQYGEWAEEELYLLAHALRSGDTVLDIGANVGSHAIAFGRMVSEAGRVLAIDGQRRASAVLNLNILLNGAANIARIEGLVGRRDALVRLPDAAGPPTENLGCASFRDALARPAPVAPGLPVPLFTVDSLALPACRLIKIDVEGMELDVLSGAAETIARHRPIVYFEQTSAADFTEIVALLRGADYDLRWHVANPYNRNNFRGASDNVFGGACEVNILAVHRSEAFAPPPGIDAPPVASDRYEPPPSATGRDGWSLPLDAYRDLSAARRRPAIAMPPPPDLVVRSAYALLEARFRDLEQDRTRAQQIMEHQADLIARLRPGEAA